MHNDSNFLRFIVNEYGIKIDLDASVFKINDAFGGGAICIFDKNNKFLIKKINNSYDKKRVLFHLNYQRRLYLNGISCPEVYVTKKGKLFVGLFNENFYLQSWCDGKSYWWIDLTVEERLNYRKQVGELLGNIHLLVVDEEICNLHSSVLVDMHCLLKQSNEIISSLSSRLCGKFCKMVWIMIHLPFSLKKRLINLFPEMDHIIKHIAFDSRYKKLNYNDLIASHGDWNHENLLFRDSQISCLIDFDNARIVPRAYDIGSALATVCFCGEHEEEFLSAYELSSGLKRPNPEVIRVCVLTRILNSLSWQLVNFPKLRGNQKEKSEWWMLQLCQALESELPYHVS